jgi:hypothetical protein
MNARRWWCAAAFVAFAACDVATTGRLELRDAVYDCRASRSPTVYSFDPRTEEPHLWQGTSGYALEFTDLSTGERVKLANADGWVCEPRPAGELPSLGEAP